MPECSQPPPRQVPSDDSGYLEALARAIFQAGFSWQVVRDKWPAIRRAFEGFDIDAVASYGSSDIDRLLGDPAIIRNGRKIEAIIQNARIMQQLVAEHGSMHAYLRSLDSLSYARKRRELIRRFHHVGPTGVFVFLYCVGEEVPDWDERRAEDA